MLSCSHFSYNEVNHVLVSHLKELTLVLGIIYSVIVSVLFSAYLIPRKFTRQNPFAYTVWIGMAFFAATAILYTIITLCGWGFPEPLFSTWHLLSMLTGVLWTVGSASVFIAVDKIGLSKSTLWKNLQGPIAAMLMLVFLSDVVGSKIWLVLAGTVVMFISALLFTINKDKAERKNSIFAIALSVLAAFCYGANAFIQKLLANNGFVFTPVLYCALFVFISALIVYAIKYRNVKSIFVTKEHLLLAPLAKSRSCDKESTPTNPITKSKSCSYTQSQRGDTMAHKFCERTSSTDASAHPSPAKHVNKSANINVNDTSTKFLVPDKHEKKNINNNHSIISSKPSPLLKQMLPPIIAGIVYSLACIFNMLAYKEIAGSVAFSIIQANTIWTVLLGIFLFKEINFKKNWLRLCSGFILVIGAIALLVLAL